MLRCPACGATRFKCIVEVEGEIDKNGAIVAINGKKVNISRLQSYCCVICHHKGSAEQFWVSADEQHTDKEAN